MRDLGGGFGGFWSFGSRRSPFTMMLDGKGYEHRNEEKDRLKEARKIKNLTRKESSE